MDSQKEEAKPEWREFENLAARIQQQLAPEAKVSTNVKLSGKRTRIERQIDILVEQTVGQYSIRIIIDCKDYKTPVDVKDVEAFMGMVEDVGANKGAMVAASGFTATAKKRAHDAGIDLYRLVDSENTKWRAYVSIPCVMRDVFIESFSFTFKATGYFRLENSDPRFMTLFRADGSPIDCLCNLVLDRWQTGAITANPGKYRDIPVFDGETFVKTDGKLYKMAIFIHAVVGERLYFGQLPLSEITGFVDERTGDLLTTGFLTAPVDPYEMEKNWERINSLEQLAIKPAIVWGIKSSAARFESGQIS